MTTPRRVFLSSVAGLLSGGCLPQTPMPEAVEETNAERVRRIVRGMNQFDGHKICTCISSDAHYWCVRYTNVPQFPQLTEKERPPWESYEPVHDAIIQPGQHCCDSFGRILPWAPGYFVMWRVPTSNELSSRLAVRVWS